MGETMITLHAGDCLTAPWRSKRNAWLTDPPANIAFMGRKWDKAAAELGFDFEGAELCPEAVEITNARLAYWSGLSIQALESFKLTGELPDVKPADKRQQSLF